MAMRTGGANRRKRPFLRIGAVAGLVAAALPLAVDVIGASGTDPGVLGGNLAIWARDEVKLDRDSSVTSGSTIVDVVAQNAVASGAHSVRMVSGATTDAGVRTIGDQITVDASATAGGDVYFQTLTNKGTILGGQFGSLMVPVPITDAPAFRIGTPGTTNVTVPRNGSMTITPGAYGDVMIDRGATIVLYGAGDYVVRSMTLARGATVQVDALSSVEVLVKERFASGPGGSFGPAASAPISAANIAVYVEGASDTTQASGRIGNDGVFEGTMFVRMDGPQLTVGSNADVTGALFGTRVKLDMGASLHAASFFGGADLSISKDDSVDPVLAGNQLTYTITVSNAGPHDAGNVQVSDSLPAGVSNASTVGCAEDPGGVPTCSLGTIAAGASKSYTVTVDVDSDTLGVVTNSASVSSDTFDPDLSNNSVSEDTTVVAEADLSIAKSDDVDPIIAGNTLTYTVDVTNAGPSDAQNVQVSDTLPAGVTFVATSGCGNDPNGVPSCALGTIVAGGSAQFTIEVTVDAGTAGTITNSADVSSTTTDPNSTNNSVSEDTLVLPPEADLSITKTDNPDPVVAGENLTYTITVDNAGPAPAENVVVTDTLPAGVAFVSTSGCSNDPAGVPTCSLGTIAAGGSAQFTVDVSVGAGTVGVITNQASVTSDTTDPDGSNNTTSESTTVNEPQADLSIAKSDSADPIVAGNTLTYTVTVSNAGPQAAQNVVVTDTLPAGVTFVQTVGCGGDPNGVPTCALGTIAAGGSAQFTIEVTVDAGTVGTITNTAAVTSDTDDPNTGDNTASENTTVNAPQADLSIAKSDDVDPIPAGNTLTYTVTVSNAGPQAAQNVVVTDTLPAGVTFVQTVGCGGDPNGVPTCALGTIVAGGSAQFTIEVTVDSGTLGTITNTASVTSDTADPNTSDNTAGEDTLVSGPPQAVDDTVAAGSSPGDDHHTALNTTLTVVDDSTEDLLVNDNPGVPPGDISHFGGGDLGGAITDNLAGATATFGGAGSLTVNPNGTYVFTPDTDFVGLFTFDYRVTNTAGSSDATVTIAVGARPDAQPDSRSAIGNVGLDTSLAPTFSFLDNDSGDVVVVDSIDDSATQGTVVHLGGGQFTYVPPPGFEGVDIFDYTISNGLGTDTDTVAISVVDVIWFIDNSAGAGDGRLNTPFNTLSAFNAAADDPGDVIFIHETGSGDYSGNLTLMNAQVLIGQGAGDTIANIAGITVPLNTPALPSTGGTSPVLTVLGTGNAIDVATDNTIRGLDIGSTNDTGISGTQVGTLFVREVGISGSGGGVDLRSTTGAPINVIFDDLSSTSASHVGILLSGVSGSLSITDTTGTISTTNRPAIDIDGGASGVSLNMTFSSLSSSNSNGDGIRIRDVANGSTVNGGTVSISNPVSNGIDLDDIGSSDFDFGTTTITSRGATGIDIDNAAGTFDFGPTTVSNAGAASGHGIRIGGSSGAFTFASTTISDTAIGTANTYNATRGLPIDEGDGDGIFLTGLSGSFTTNGGTISSSADNGVDIRSSRNVTLNNLTIDQNFAGNSGVFGHNVFNLDVIDSIIREIDDVNAAALVTDSGMRLTEIEGTLNIQRTQIINSEGYVFANASVGAANRAVELETRTTGAPASSGCTVQDGTGNCSLTVNVTGSTFTNWDFQGLNLRHIGGSLTVNIDGSTADGANTFTNINGAAVNTGPSQAFTSNTHAVTVNDNSFTDVGIAAELFSSRGGNTVATVDTNTITGTISDAVRLVAFNQTGGGTAANYTGKVINNNITDIADRVHGSGGGAGVFIAAEDGVSANVLVNNNSLTGHTTCTTGGGPGCNSSEAFRTQNQRDGVLDVTFDNNVVTDFPSSLFSSLFLGNDFDTTGPAFTDTCVNFGSSNSYSNTNSQFGFTFATDSTGSSIMDLPNGFNSALPATDFGNAPTANACLAPPP